MKELLQGVEPFLNESDVSVLQNKPIEELKHFFLEQRLNIKEVIVMYS